MYVCVCIGGFVIEVCGGGRGEYGERIEDRSFLGLRSL